ncbi:hypothetical protein C0030_006150 [Candidatus Liberibacter solanacearum]|uniref:Uncharacterized protein n=2 Tax=Candidatus Liberibacter solanacearum TaxID=556287 RepID=A0A424FKR8_9HYPH|nr:hypothetical protein C0030_006150 [Candidatus Liberibacter solanacearum]
MQLSTGKEALKPEFLKEMENEACGAVYRENFDDEANYYIVLTVDSCSGDLTEIVSRGTLTEIHKALEITMKRLNPRIKSILKRDKAFKENSYWDLDTENANKDCDEDTCESCQ